MNNCYDCRWCGKGFVNADVGIYVCKKLKEHDKIYGNISMRCEEVRGNKDHCEHWEQGGIKGWWQRFKRSWQRASADPLKDPRCKG